MAGEKRVGSWMSASDKDPITQAPRARAQANNRARPPAFLQVRCYDKVPMVLVGTVRDPYGASDLRWVVLRIDQRPAVVVPMAGLKGTRVLAARLGRDTYAGLATARQVAVRAIDTDGSHTDMVYDLAKTGAAMAPVLALCPPDSALDRAAAVYDPAKQLPPVPPAGQATPG